MDIYVTQSGDAWDLISYRVYGSESYIVELQRANPLHMSTLVFGAGVRLICPDIPIREDSNLPPWKKRRVAE